MKQVSQNIHGGVPTLVGEFGIPYDMNNAKAYQTGNFKHQVQALNMYYNILDELQINSTQWNYTPDNSNSWGDKWNMEDLSIFSRDQQEEYSDLDSGGRAIAGFCRPYPRYISGEPRSWSFNLDKRRFQFSYLHHGSEYPTVVYVPKFHYPNGVIVNCVPKIDWTYSPGEQLLRLKSDNTVEISLEIFPS